MLAHGILDASPSDSMAYTSDEPKHLNDLSLPITPMGLLLGTACLPVLSSMNWKRIASMANFNAQSAASMRHRAFLVLVTCSASFQMALGRIGTCSTCYESHALQSGACGVTMPLYHAGSIAKDGANEAQAVSFCIEVGSMSSQQFFCLLLHDDCLASLPQFRH